MKNQYQELYGLVSLYKTTLAFVILLMLFETALTLTSPWLAGRFTELLLNESKARFTYHEIFSLWLVILALQAITRFWNSYLVAMTGETILSQMRVRIYDHIQSLPLKYFYKRKKGEILTLLTNDADIVSDFVINTLVNFLPQMLTLLGALYFIYLIDPFFALLIGILTPLFVILIKLLGRSIRPISRAMVESYAKTFSIVEENLQLLPIIKSFTREKKESNKFNNENSNYLKLTNHYLWVQSKLSPLSYFMASTTILILLWVGSVRVESGLLTIDGLVSLLFYGMLLTRPVNRFSALYGEYQHAKGASARLVDTFKAEVEPIYCDKPELTSVKGAIEFSNVNFSYEDRNIILRDLNFKIEPGETIAITGENGSGKSTITYLLQRFSQPQDGCIYIDGNDILKINLASLRRYIGVVSQQVLLLNGTVYENILFGKADADFKTVNNAAIAAHAIDFINKLPEGFETIIGDQGVKLSGGERQRLALARALLKDAPILILDEATAMFDPESEKKFIEECHGGLNNKTVILITHRPASLALADRVLELRDGKIY